MRKKDLKGLKFGSLTVLSESHGNTSKKKKWDCLCECGEIKSILGGNLIRGRTISCGCVGLKNRMQAVLHHGFSYHPLRNVYQNMIRRCYDKKNISYARYGGRGIFVCDEWKSSLEDFCKWALANGYSKGLSIDRINNDGPYTPLNCRWANSKTQARNRHNNRIITCRGVSKTLAEFAETVGETVAVIHHRIRRGWTEEDAIFTPFKRNKKC